MESRFDRRELLFQPRGIPPLGTSLSLALQHLVAMIVGCVTPPIIIAGAPAPVSYTHLTLPTILLV